MKKARNPPHNCQPHRHQPHRRQPHRHQPHRHQPHNWSRGGRRPDWTGPVVNPPVWRASTHLYPDIAALKAGTNSNDDGSFFYGRRGSPSQWSLAQALTEMEPGAAGTMLYPSGVAAIAASLLSVLRPGDELLLTDNCYDPSRSYANGFLQQMGVTARYFDPMIGGGNFGIIYRKNTCYIARKSRQPDL